MCLVGCRRMDTVFDPGNYFGVCAQKKILSKFWFIRVFVRVSSTIGCIIILQEHHVWYWSECHDVHRTLDS